MPTSLQERQERAIACLSRRDRMRQPAQVVESLSSGLSVLRNLFLTRVHDDVEAYFGVDSMLAPMTLTETRKELYQAKLEIETYNIATAVDEVRQGNYLEGEAEWLSDWLLQLRLGDDVPEGVQLRLAGYLKRGADEQRLLFAGAIEHTLPEALKAPLIIYRLYPLGVRMAVAIAFHDPLRGIELRNEQMALLPAIGDCNSCHGRPLDNGDVCSTCGNPLWKIRWLNAAD